jgi:hypothetical protein
MGSVGKRGACCGISNVRIIQQHFAHSFVGIWILVVVEAESAKYSLVVFTRGRTQLHPPMRNSSCSRAARRPYPGFVGPLLKIAVDPAVFFASIAHRIDQEKWKSSTAEIGRVHVLALKEKILYF